MSNLSSIEQRALAAYYRGSSNSEGSISQPGEIQEVEHEGLQYVVLANTNGILAIYRIRTVNALPVLKRLKRWPAALTDMFG